jgi:hypothetical protein
MAAVPLVAGSPDLGAPALVRRVALVALQAATGKPTLGTGVLGQSHRINAPGASAGHPQLGRPREAMLFPLLPHDLVGGPPELGTPALRKRDRAISRVVITGGAGRQPVVTGQIGRTQIASKPSKPSGGIIGQLGGPATIIGRASRARVEDLEEV